jgi:hypothetical protein
MNMKTEDNEEGTKVPEKEHIQTEKNEEKISTNEPEKKQNEERNNSKQTGMPFGFDKLFFRSRPRIKG